MHKTASDPSECDWSSAVCPSDLPYHGNPSKYSRTPSSYALPWSPQSFQWGPHHFSLPLFPQSVQLDPQYVCLTTVAPVSTVGPPVCMPYHGHPSEYTRSTRRYALPGSLKGDSVAQEKSALSSVDKAGQRDPRKQCITCVHTGCSGRQQRARPSQSHDQLQ